MPGIGPNAATLQLLLGSDPALPSTAPDADPFTARLGTMAGVLASAWPNPSPETTAMTRAIVTHAVTFSTWRSLAQGELGDGPAIDLLTAFVAAIAVGELSPTP